MTIAGWSFKMRSLQEIKLAALLAAMALLVSLAPSAFAADTAPDWLRSAAQQKLPDYDKDTVAVILLDDTQTTIQSNGEIDTRHRMAIRLLRSDARRDYGSIEIPF